MSKQKSDLKENNQVLNGRMNKTKPYNQKRNVIICGISLKEQVDSRIHRQNSDRIICSSITRRFSIKRVILLLIEMTVYLNNSKVRKVLEEWSKSKEEKLSFNILIEIYINPNLHSQKWLHDGVCINSNYLFAKLTLSIICYREYTFN